MPSVRHQQPLAVRVATPSPCRSVIWGLLADSLIFHSLPDLLSVLGAAIVCSSSFLVAIGQKKGGARQPAAPVTAAIPAPAAEGRQQRGQPLLSSSTSAREGEMSLADWAAVESWPLLTAR